MSTTGTPRAGAGAGAGAGHKHGAHIQRMHNIRRHVAVDALTQEARTILVYILVFLQSMCTEIPSVGMLTAQEAETQQTILDTIIRTLKAHHTFEVFQLFRLYTIMVHAYEKCCDETKRTKAPDAIDFLVVCILIQHTFSSPSTGLADKAKKTLAERTGRPPTVLMAAIAHSIITPHFMQELANSTHLCTQEAFRRDLNNGRVPVARAVPPRTQVLTRTNTHCMM